MKYFEKLLTLWEPLYHVGCERDKAGNRDLHYDQLCVRMLMGVQEVDKERTTELPLIRRQPSLSGSPGCGPCR